MAAPAPTVYTNGSLVPVSADGLNTMIQNVTNVAQLRTITGVPGMCIWSQGTSTPGDGGQVTYGWSATSTAADNGTSVIVPYGSTLGAWLSQPTTNSSTSFASITVSGSVIFGASVATISLVGSELSLNATTILTTGATTLGDLAVTASHAASSVLAGPTGAAGAPTWRQLSTSDITGLGTMAAQNASAVAITGGSLSGVTLTTSTITAAAITATTFFTVSSGNLTSGALGSAAGALSLVDSSRTNYFIIETGGLSFSRILTLDDPGVTTSYFQLNTVAPTASNLSGNLRIRLESCRNADGSAMAASASSGKFGISITAGTSQFLVTEVANSSTVTDVCSFEIVLPSSYTPGVNVTLLVNCNYVLGSGTIGTHTLTMAAYLCADAGTQGANIIGTGAQAVPASAGLVSFIITGTSLTSGARLFVTGTMVIQDTGGHAVTGNLNSIQFS